MGFINETIFAIGWPNSSSLRDCLNGKLIENEAVIESEDEDYFDDLPSMRGRQCCR